MKVSKKISPGVLPSAWDNIPIWVHRADVSSSHEKQLWQWVVWTKCSFVLWRPKTALHISWCEVLWLKTLCYVDSPTTRFSGLHQHYRCEAASGEGLEKLIYWLCQIYLHGSWIQGSNYHNPIKSMSVKPHFFEKKGLQTWSNNVTKYQVMGKGGKGKGGKGKGTAMKAPSMFGEELLSWHVKWHWVSCFL